MTQLSHSLRIIGAVALAALLLAVPWGAVAWVAMQAISLHDSVESDRAALAVMQAKTGTSASLNVALRDTAADRAAIAVESRYAPIDIVNEIRSIANDAGVDVSIDTIDPSALPGAIRGVPALAVSMSAHDSFAKLYRFVELLEVSPLPLQIDQVSFDQLATAPSVPWTLEARVSVYTENAQSQ